MADDKAKKPKIDLKARLGRTTQLGMGAPASLPVPAVPGGMPPPPASDPSGGSVPPSSDAAPRTAPPAAIARPPMGIAPGIAPPPGLSPGIPIPPFQQRAQPRAEPKQSAAQQTIKVEIGEEIHEERAKARRRAMLAAAAGVAIGLGIGWVGGGSAEKGDRAKIGAKVAGALEKEVKGANDKLKELDEKLTDAADNKLAKKIYPDDLAGALAGLVIPFEPTNLDKTGISGVPQKVFKPLIAYTRDVENINKSRERLKSLLGLAKEPITKAWKEEAAPVANYSVVFRSEGGKGVIGELVPTKDAFPWKGDFPGKYKVLRNDGGKQVEKDVNRWQKGDLTGSDLVAIPVDPKSTAAFSSEVISNQLLKAIYEMRTELQGNKDNPTDEKAGLLKTGEDLATALHQASLIQ
jgi:hypothetical protein